MTGMFGSSSRQQKLNQIELLKKWTGFLTRRRCFRNKGALLILLWNFSAFLVFAHSFNSSFEVQFCLLASMLLYPLAGWLADVYFGRYKVIKYSMWIMWCSAVTENIWILVKHYNHSHIIYYIIEVLCKAASFVGLAGFLSNAIQFSIDQLVDASSVEISSYISWHTWIFYLSKCAVVLTQTCFCSWFDKSLTHFIFPLSFTVSLVSDIFLNKWLIKEPVTQNPLKLIYQVLHYAVKNKYPRLRSAFTYWEDKPYHRIDLAKTKYGGPFSAEQVENVKSFIRILLLVAAASIFSGLILCLYYANGILQYYYEDSGCIFDCTTSSNSATCMNNCILRAVVGNLSMFILVFFIPFFEWVLYPSIKKCILCSRHCLFFRFLLGMFLTFVYCLSIVCLEITANYNSSKENNTKCLLHDVEKSQPHHAEVHLDYKWLMLPQISIGLSVYLLFTSGMEFVYAQTPYGMRGIVMGVVFFFSSLSIGLSYSYIEVIRKISRISDFMRENCELWYFGSIAAFSLLCLIAGLVIKKKYTLRRRDDDTHNEQIFVVEYYDKYLEK